MARHVGQASQQRTNKRYDPLPWLPPICDFRHIKTDVSARDRRLRYAPNSRTSMVLTRRECMSSLMPPRFAIMPQRLFADIIIEQLRVARNAESSTRQNANMVWHSAHLAPILTSACRGTSHSPSRKLVSLINTRVWRTFSCGSASPPRSRW